MNLLAATILYIPYRRGEKWAWNVMWVLVVANAMIIFFNAQLGLIYLGQAALLVIGQLLAYRAFLAQEAN